MKTKETWEINKTVDFSDIEKIDIYLEIHKDGTATAIKDAKHTFLCKPLPSFKFLFKRYPFVIVPAIILSLIFLWLHPIAFFIYALLTIIIFTLAIRLCGIRSIGRYIMIFWVLHLLGNFFILGGGSLSSFSLALSERHYYVQSLFFGMLLTHIWIYILIFLQQYYRVFNIIEEENTEQIATPWYIWKGCRLCNPTYNPFKNNCKDI